ncbi:MAG: hypothetical protein H7211_05390 [Aquabacterium sp.]|nr:hypothetical protein [Ferruginibacter sp.]
MLFCVIRFIIYYPGKEAAMGIIVVSLPCTAYQCGSFIGMIGKSGEINALALSFTKKEKV